jgi:hypothetical protein
MTPEITVHRATRVRMVITQPMQCEGSSQYRIGKMVIESDGKDTLRIDLFSDSDDISEIYPMVELERPQ